MIAAWEQREKILLRRLFFDYLNLFFAIRLIESRQGVTKGRNQFDKMTRQKINYYPYLERLKIAVLVSLINSGQNVGRYSGNVNNIGRQFIMFALSKTYL